MATERKALDVWFKFTDDDEFATYEANTYRDSDNWFVVEWYHNDVGLVSRKFFSAYALATAWLESEGFEDFSTGEEN